MGGAAGEVTRVLEHCECDEDVAGEVGVVQILGGDGRVEFVKVGIR